jgi:hypothetical protein
MSPWDRLLEKPACAHLVQLYQTADKLPLINNVARYMAEGLGRGESSVGVITPEHRELLNAELERLGVDTRAAVREKRLVWLDAQETLSRFIMSGWPDWNRFDAVVGAVIRSLRPTPEDPAFRAYGEMVNILWQAGQFAAALRLEQFWNKLLSRFSFSLYCAYAADASDQKGRAALEQVLSTHTHVIPADSCQAVQPVLAGA